MRWEPQKGTDYLPREIENILLGPSHPGRAASLWSVGKGGLYCLQPLNCFSGGSGSVVAFKPLQSFDFICLFFFVLLYSVIHAASMGFPLLGIRTVECMKRLSDTLCTNHQTLEQRRFALTCDMLRQAVFMHVSGRGDRLCKGADRRRARPFLPLFAFSYAFTN